MPFLVTPHRVAGGFVPLTGGFLVQFSGLNQGSLDFLHALRLRSHSRTPDFISAVSALAKLC